MSRSILLFVFLLLVPVATSAQERKSDPLLNSLYVTTAVMQGLDAHSTLYAISRGATEANPFMANVVEHKSTFIALKAGVAFSTIMASREMSKRNRVAAIVTMVAVNSAMAYVVQRNYRIGRAGR